MDVGLLLIAIIFLTLIFSRFYSIRKPAYGFLGILLKGKKAVVERTISAVFIAILAYGLIFQYFWAFILFVVDFVIGLITHISVLIIAIKNPEDLPKELFTNPKFTIKLMSFLIMFWILIMVYVYKAYFL